MNHEPTLAKVQLTDGLGLSPERAAFEAWCDARWGNCSHLHKSNTCGEWTAWQAAVAAERERLAAEFDSGREGDILRPAFVARWIRGA